MLEGSWTYTPPWLLSFGSLSVTGQKGLSFKRERNGNPAIHQSNLLRRHLHPLLERLGMVENTVTGRYVRMATDRRFRRFRMEVAERIGLGFELPQDQTGEDVPNIGEI
jgi:hypothetical protein